MASDQRPEVLDDLLPWVVAVLIEHAPATTRPTEGTPGDVVYDVPEGHEVRLRQRGQDASVTVSKPSGRPETQEALRVLLRGAEQRPGPDGALVLTGSQFARGNAWQVTVTLVRG